MKPQKQYISRKKLFGIPFPLLKLTTLESKDIVLPKAISKKATVLYLAGPQSSQSDLDSWSASIRKRFQSEDITHFEILFISNQSKKEAIIDTLKNEINSEFHSMVAIASQPFEDLKKTLLLVDPADIFVFVLDEYGKVIFSAQGPADEFRIYRINKAIHNAVTTDQDLITVRGEKAKEKKKVAFYGKIDEISATLINELIESSQVQEVQLLIDKPTQFHHVKLFEQILTLADIDAINTIDNYDELIVYNVSNKDIKLLHSKAESSHISTLKAIIPNSRLITSKQEVELKKNINNCNLILFNQYVFLGLPSKTFANYIKKLSCFIIAPFLIGKLKKYRPVSLKSFSDKIIKI